jgi:hypothetical protein
MSGLLAAQAQSAVTVLLVTALFNMYACAFDARRRVAKYLLSQRRSPRGRESTTRLSDRAQRVGPHLPRGSRKPRGAVAFLPRPGPTSA